MITTATSPAVDESRITVAFNVLRLLDRPTSTCVEVAEAMEQDPVLDRQVLKMARSPLCGIRSPDLTVSRALVMLGFITVRKLVVVSLCRVLGSLGEGNESRWRRGLWVGIAAEEIALRLDETAASEALMAGMTSFISADLEDRGATELVATASNVSPARMQQFVQAAENVADCIIVARPGLPSTAEVDEALEAAGLMPQQDGKLALDIRRGYEVYASLLT